MAYFEGEKHKKAFENSYTTVFAFDGDKLIGFGRAISDGAYEAALYDLAVLPEYQGKHVGATIFRSLLERTGECNFILFAAPGKEPFYKKFNFRMMKTGMAHFVRAEEMRNEGFTE
jgi:predicted N-acetyltransferase YhbS